MNKIAVISDIHGNLEALKSVLDDIASRKIEKIICLGDIIAKGTHQQECVELVKNKCDIVLQGNCDEYFTRKDIDLQGESDIQIKRIQWNGSKISDSNKKYLQELPYCYELYVSGRLVRLFHATPDKIDSFVGNVDTIDRLYKLFLPSENTISNKKADIAIYGHIHTPFIQKIYNRTIINTGSVGNAIDVFRNKEKDGNIKNTTVANYAIISGIIDSTDMNDAISYELVSVSYDINRELESNNDNIEFENYANELKTGTYRDMGKIYDSFKVRGIDKNKV